MPAHERGLTPQPLSRPWPFLHVALLLPVVVQQYNGAVDVPTHKTLPSRQEMLVGGGDGEVEARYILCIAIEATGFSVAVVEVDFPSLVIVLCRSLY